MMEYFSFKKINKSIKQIYLKTLQRRLPIIFELIKLIV